jgi:uncharacterized protein (TIGR03435 family)
MLRPLILLAAAALTAGAQSFETASIKRSDPADAETSWHPTPGLLRTRGMTLKRLIMLAYDVKPYQVFGGPKWAETERYDIVAKTGGEAPPSSNIPLQKLLAARFHLKVREETRPASGYALVVAKSGLRIKTADASGGNSYSYGPSGFSVKGMSMDFVTGGLASILKMPVVNATGLDGVYDFRIEFAPEGAPDSAASEKPSIFTVLQEALGLRLEPRKVAMRVVVVDGAEKPDEN